MPVGSSAWAGDSDTQLWPFNAEAVVGGRYRRTAVAEAVRGIRVGPGETSDGAMVTIWSAPVAGIGSGSLARLRHDVTRLSRRSIPGLTQVVYLGQEQSWMHLVAQRPPGVSLADRLAKSALTLSEVLALANRVLEALAGLHEEGVLHLGIRPANIWLSADGSVDEVLLDELGVARLQRMELVDPAARAELVAYTSPELAGVLAVDVDERSDLYAIGTVLFECVAQRAPFRAATSSEVLRQQLAQDAPDLRGLGFDVPHAFDLVLQRLLARDPRDRYQSAAAAREDVQTVATSVALGDAPSVLTIRSRERRRRLVEATLVGRAEELAEAARQAEAARLGRGGLMLVEAESGVGKTRLLSELRAHQMARGALVLTAAGLDQAAIQPYQTLGQLADGLLTAVEGQPELGDSLQRRLGDRCQAIAAALPQLAGILGSTSQEPVPEGFGAMRSRDALAALIDCIGAPGRPALLLLDDAQWADEATLSVLEYWQRVRVEQRYVLVVLAARSEDLSPDHQVRRLALSAQLRLPPLGPTDIQRVVESMAGPLPLEILELVIDLADGSPFMAAAVMWGLVESRALMPDDAGGWWFDAEGLAQARASTAAATFLSRRLDLLPTNARALLTVGAVLGKDFEVTLAAAVAGVSEAEALPALDEARGRRIVWLRENGARCSFVHDKLRESLLEQLSATDRRALHRRAAEHIQAAEPHRTFDLAYHFDAAGEADRALPFALQSAEEARLLHALDAAEIQYRIALRSPPADDPGLRRQIAEGLGDVLTLRGQYDEAESEIIRARAQVKEPHDLAELERKLADVAFKRGNVKQGVSACEAALRHLKQPVPGPPISLGLQFARELVVQVAHTLLPRWFVGRRGEPGRAQLLAIRLYSDLSLNYYFDRGLLRTLWAVLRSLNLAERHPPTEELARAYADHTVAMAMTGQFARAVGYGRKSLAIRRASRHVWGQGQSLNRLGIALYGAGRYEEALETSREAVRILERTGDIWEGNSIARLQVAYAQWRLGDLAGAVETGRRVHEIALRVGDHQGAAYGLWAWSVASGGHLPDHLLQAELDRPQEASLVRVYLLMAVALKHLAERRLVEAAQSLQEAQRRIHAERTLGGDYLVPVELMLATVLRLRAEGQSLYAPDERRRVLAAAQRAARLGLRQARTFKNNLPYALRECGLLAAARGDIGAARRLLNESLAGAERQGARAESALTRAARGQLGQVHGWPEANDDVNLAQRALSSLGATNPGQAVDAPSLSLIDRFDTLLEVGRRIASGLTRSTVFAAVEEATLLLLRAERCRILLLEPEGQSTRLVDSSGGVVEHSILVLANRALTDMRPATVTDWRNDTVDAADRSAVAAPILVRGAATACLYAGHSQVPGLFGDDEVRLAAFITALGGAALENAEGVSEIEGLTREIESNARDLAAKNVELSRLDRLKDEFMANTSHELRTPLNAMVGIADSLIDGAAGAVSSNQRRNLEMIVTSGRRLANLVNDILDFSRLKQHDLPLHARPVDARSVASIVLALTATTAAAKGLRLINAIDPDSPAVYADEDRLQQILLNLVGNAVKFTDTGTVTVTARRQEDSLAISVTDTGIGIAATAQTRIFESFEQADGSDIRSQGGTGLGLAISKQLVELHGGSLYVNSQPGEGSTFTVTLPLSSQPAEVAPKGELVARVHDSRAEQEPELFSDEVAAPPNRFVVLAIDDETVNLQVVSNHLSLRGYVVVRAHSAADALNFIESNGPPDLVLLDVMMPRMSGYELCRELRQRYSATELPVILLTAKSRVEDLVQGFASGANDYLVKPFSREELMARIQSHLSLTRLTQATARFVPREFLSLLGQPSVAEISLGDNAQVDMSVLFSDIRSYTTLSERMSPRQNLEFINAYLSHVSPVVRAHGGIIEQYYGDGFKALFAGGVEHAIGAAIDLRRAVVRYNLQRRGAGEPDIDIGVGVHTGPILLGAIGDADRLAVAIMSDIVNTTSRLEGLTKLYGVGIVVSEQVVRQLPDPTQFEFKYLGKVQVKGKTETLSVYEVFVGEQEHVIELKRVTRADFEEGLRLYHARRFAQASEHFDRVLAVATDDRAAQLYAQRARECLTGGTPPGWRGVEVLSEK